MKTLTRGSISRGKKELTKKKAVVMKSTTKRIAKSGSKNAEVVQSLDTLFQIEKPTTLMTSESLDQILPTIKESLLFEKSQILNTTHEFKRAQLENVQLSDEAEVASNDISNNLSIHLHERSLKSLMEIDKALNKISNGTYGECEDCGELITPRRLQARPLAPLCISCMEEKEQFIRNSNQ